MECEILNESFHLTKFVVHTDSIISEEDADRVWSCVENAIQVMAEEEE